MRLRILFPVLMAMAFAPGVFARVTVRGDLSASKYLLYEPVRLRLTVKNESGQVLILGGDAANVRLFFQVSDVENKVIPSTDVPVFPEPWRIAPGETVSRDFNLMKHFQIRSPGDYRLLTRFHMHDESLEDKPKLFEISKGTVLREIKNSREDRAFLLTSFNRDDRDELLLQITNAQGTRIFQTYFLGKHLRFYPPEFRKGLDGSVAILHRTAPEQLAFAVFNADGTPGTRRTLNIKANERVQLEEDPERGFVVRGDARIQLESFQLGED